MASNNAMATALALPSSKTNWAAIVPARAPPPPPPQEQYEEEATTEFARNKICDECGCKGGCELTCVYVCGEPCEICGATSDITDDWHGNSVCDECFMCCEECYNTKNPAVFEKTASDLCECEDKVQCEHCEGAVSDEGGIIVVMGQEMTICESCDMGGDCYDGFLDQYHYNPETNDYEEENDETCDGCMEVFHEDELACLCSNEKCGLFQKNCCKDCCAKNKCEDCVEEDEQTCDGCGTTCLDHTSNKGRGSESPCEECEETRCKLCPCACEENQVLAAQQEEFWDGGMKEMWGEELCEGHPLWEPFKLYMAMKKEQDA